MIKKILLVMTIIWASLGSTFAGYTIDDKLYYDTNEAGLITSCDDDVAKVGLSVWDVSVEDEDTIKSVCGWNNEITRLTAITGDNSIATSTSIMAGPIGYMIYFILGIWLLGFVVYTIRKWF